MPRDRRGSGYKQRYKFSTYDVGGSPRPSRGRSARTTRTMLSSSHRSETMSELRCPEMMLRADWTLPDRRSRNSPSVQGMRQPSENAARSPNQQSTRCRSTQARGRNRGPTVGQHFIGDETRPAFPPTCSSRDVLRAAGSRLVLRDLAYRDAGSSSSATASAAATPTRSRRGRASAGSRERTLSGQAEGTRRLQRSASVASSKASIEGECPPSPEGHAGHDARMDPAIRASVRESRPSTRRSASRAELMSDVIRPSERRQAGASQAVATIGGGDGAALMNGHRRRPTGQAGTVACQAR